MSVPLKSGDFRLRIRGRYGCFTRPETKMERLSYEVITPPAAIGVLSAIFWHTGMVWKISEIALLGPIKYMPFRRNEVQMGPSRNHLPNNRGVINKPYVTDDAKMRTQRNTMLLVDPDFAVTAHIEFVPSKANPSDNMHKFVNMFTERVNRGQCYNEPYLGCSEFPGSVEWYEGDPQPQKITRDLGMIHCGGWTSKGEFHPLFFRAKMINGVIQVPEIEVS